MSEFTREKIAARKLLIMASTDPVTKMVRIANSWGTTVRESEQSRRDRLLTQMAVVELEAEFALREWQVLTGVTIYEVIGLLDRLALAANAED